MIPKWKLKRELNRIGQQLRMLPEFFYERYKQKKYDKYFIQSIKVHNGDVLDAHQVGIFLIYQPRGLSQSSVETCTHLSRNGFAPLIVVNGDLSSDDLQILLRVSWRVVVRPNYGYDFGGYRDGVKLLVSWRVVPDNLIILNDSIWFPLDVGDATIEQMSATAGDFVGVKGFSKSKSGFKIKPDFFESYFFYIKRAAFIHPAFFDFWDNYRLSNNKYKAVHEGEQKFSPTMASGGIPIAALFNREIFWQALEPCDNQFLNGTLVYAACVDDDLEMARQHLLQVWTAQPAWRNDALAFIRKVIDRRDFHASFCFAAIRLLGMSYLKKNNSPLHRKMRKCFVTAVNAGDLPKPTQSVWREIQESIE